MFRCSSLPSVFGENACDNSLVARYCCDRCPEPGQKGTHLIAAGSFSIYKLSNPQQSLDCPSAKGLLKIKDNRK